MGVYKRRNGGAKTKPRNDQILSEDENSIQDVRLAKLMKTKRLSLLKTPARKWCGNYAVGLGVLLLALACCAYVYSYVDTAPVVDTLKTHASNVIETLQKFAIELYKQVSPQQQNSEKINSAGKSEETDLEREKDVLHEKEEAEVIVDNKEQEFTKKQKSDRDAKLEPHDQPAAPPSGSFVNQKADDVTAEPKDVTVEPKDATVEPNDVTVEPNDATVEPNEAQAKPSHQERYHNAHITNQADFEVREKLDAADGFLRQGRINEGRKIFEEIISLDPQSPRATYGLAVALDMDADRFKSNAMLETAIGLYQEVLELPDVPKTLLILSGRKCSERQAFRGWTNLSVKTLERVVGLYPGELSLWNDLGVQYLTRGSNEEARKAFLKVLQHQPDDGFAKVHLGFILKVIDKRYNESIPYLQQGVDSGVSGTIDGRFFVHLGDALFRVGRHEEAQRVFELGHKKGVFLSPWQHSLHNVDRLAAHPWWTQNETGVEEQLKILEDNWEVIRDEGLAQLNDTTGVFVLEAEDLRDKGEWRQFTLFRQGQKLAGNCRRTPRTCKLFEQFPEATSCKRGQIKFSVMQPGVHVWPHCGPTNCRIRAHLGLVVPPGVRIRVVNDTRSWTEGKFIVFDDSFEHEVWHEGESFRLVLIVDIWHPELTARERATLAPI